MTPTELARAFPTDPSLAARYLQEVVHLGAGVGRGQLDEEMKLLGAAGAGELVAWFWPDRTYASDFDPFDADDPRNTRDPEEMRRRIYRDYAWLVMSAARVCGVEVLDMGKHLIWSFGFDRQRLEAVTGQVPDLRAVADYLDSLHLKFDGTWRIAHPARLALRVQQSGVATGIFLRLKAETRGVMPEGALEKWEKSLPRSSPVEGLDVITAPQQGRRYRALFEFLAQIDSPSPHLTLDELDAELISGGEDPLPESARKDKSWWAGDYTQSLGRPQIASWWAAGYRVRQVISQDADASEVRRSEVVAVVFEQLRGQPERSVGRSVSAGGGTADLFILADSEPAEVMPNELPDDRQLPDHLGGDTPVVTPVLPEDRYPEIQRLVTIMKDEGEADRRCLEQRLRDHHSLGVGGSELSNLLTKARRHGYIDNLGSRKQPRWVAINSKGHYMLQIAELLGFQCPRIPPGWLISGDFLDQVQAESGINLGAGFAAPTETLTLPDGSSATVYSKDAKFPYFPRYHLVRENDVGMVDDDRGLAALLKDVEAAVASNANSQ